MSNVTFEKVINNFISGMKESEEGSVSTTKTLRIKGDQLIHYWTPIAERIDNKIIVNITRYSIVTGKLQKQLKELVPEDKYVAIKGVREGYNGSLSDFLLGNQGV